MPGSSVQNPPPVLRLIPNLEFKDSAIMNKKVDIASLANFPNEQIAKKKMDLPLELIHIIKTINLKFEVSDLYQKIKDSFS